MDEPTAQRVFQVLWQMKKDGYSENTIKPIGRRLRNLAKHADLDLPEKVKGFIAKAKWCNGYKENMVNAYNHYAVFYGLKWRKPRYQRASSIKMHACIHIVPKKFLGKENFSKVCKSVKAMRGEWVSQGKHSYWWVPTTQETEV